MNDIIVVRGGGDLATGVVQKFHRSGFRVAVLETAVPLAIRRSVSLCTSVTEGMAQVEDLRARLTEPSQCKALWAQGEIPVLIDPQAESLAMLRPAAVVDAILAKRNLGTHCAMAPIVIALGPGFVAGQDAHAVIETMRGHDLGRVIFEGSALPNTGIPGEVGGKSALRVLHAPCAGVVTHHSAIGDVVEQGQALFSVGKTVIVAPFRGLLRGLIQAGISIPKGTKAADVDPRIDVDWTTISDKARCIGGGALEAYLSLIRR